MNIATKFDLGQRVYLINKPGQLVKQKCVACSGNGDIEFNTEDESFTFMCPNCQGYGQVEKWVGSKWQVTYEKAKIGKVQVELYRQTFINKGIEKNRITYMMDETGVGSGTLWYEDEVFGTYEEAVSECERRNAIEDQNK